ncbi:MAG TPA: hypothetical protein VLL74_01110 [Methanoregula sp.]|nr:hypothetical protein [Methanoregula sp.]
MSRIAVVQRERVAETAATAPVLLLPRTERIEGLPEDTPRTVCVSFCGSRFPFSEFCIPQRAGTSCDIMIRYRLPAGGACPNSEHVLS